MTPAPLISVITPTHNRRDQVVRAAESVLAQTVGQFEYIIVDDGSTDGTAEALSKIADPRLFYVGMEWRGANAARNTGIERAKAPVVTFLDSDDTFLPERLEKTLARFDRDPGLDLLISSFVNLKNGNLTRSTNREVFLDGESLERALVAQTIYIAGSAITARRQALLAVGGFDSDVARLQDRELLLRLARRGGAQLSQEIDWQKNSSENSISGRRDGYVEAYAHLMSKHPSIAERFPDIPPYMIARRIIADATNGRVSQALAGYKANRSAPSLGYSLPQLVFGYFRGRSSRRNLHREFRDKFGPRPDRD